MWHPNYARGPNFCIRAIKISTHLVLTKIIVFINLNNKMAIILLLIKKLDETSLKNVFMADVCNRTELQLFSGRLNCHCNSAFVIINGTSSR